MRPAGTGVPALVATLVGTVLFGPVDPRGAAAQAVWTRPAPVYALSGAGDILAAATAGGVVLWDLSSGRMQHVTTALGLPTHLVLAAAILPDSDALSAATANGMARGWFDGRWQERGARTDEKGLALSACLSLPLGHTFAGGVGGQLLHWHGSRLDSLRIPTRSGRVVALALFTAWLDTVHATTPQGLAKTGAPGFPLGLVAGLDNDGVWLLRTTGATVRWLRFVEEDGLPSHRVRHVLADSRRRLWVATDRGLAWIGADLAVRAFPADTLLTQRAHVLLEGKDGCLYVGVDAGVARLDLAAPELGATLVPGIPGPIVALSRTHEELWWSDGEHITSMSGRDLMLPAALADNYCLGVTAGMSWRGASVWVGHPFGNVSVLANDFWSRYGRAQGLPGDDITSFLQIGDSLFAGSAASGLFVSPLESSHRPRITHASVHKATAGQPHFLPVAGAPTHVSSQEVARGAHWVGGSRGLSARRGGAWEPLPLWPGATEVIDVVAAAETLWVSAAQAGLAYHDGRTWHLAPAAGEVLGAYCGRLCRSADGRIAVATDRGLALWNGRDLQRVGGSPDAFVLDVVWWGADIAIGTHRGLWLYRADGSWQMRGVLEGLPGAQVYGLDVDASGRLWVATSRGLGRLHPLAPAAASPRGVPLLQPGGTSSVPLPAPTATLVYDVRGRLLRRLAADARAGVRWDGRAADGRSVAPGVYFLRRVHTDGSKTSRKLVLR